MKNQIRYKKITVTVSRTACIIFALLVLLCACGKTKTPTKPAETALPTASIVTPALTPSPTAKPTPIATTTPVPTPSPKPTPEYIGKVTCTANEFVNIRESASTETEVIGVFPTGEVAHVIAYEGNWVHISYNGMTGYVSRTYIINSHKPGTPVPSGNWTMILVNPTHELPDEFTVDLIDFEGGLVDERILDICNTMFADAKEDGVTFKLVDAYRSYETQNKQYQKKVASYIAKGYSRDEAEMKAATITARPNTSEHQTGLALDIVTPSYTRRDSGFANTDAFKWLNANAHHYGFTLRYQKGKEVFTKVIYEPWHWRFVGVEAATAMKNSGDCFEEYLEELN